MYSSAGESKIKGTPEGKKRILILSDDSQLSLSLSLFFGQEFSVQTVDQFDRARNFIEQGIADLLLIDFGFPNNQMSQSLGSIRRKNKIPIILMYVFHEKTVPLESELRKYTDAIFYKPVNILDVLGKIRVFLR